MRHAKLALHDVHDVYGWAARLLLDKAGVVDADVQQELVLDVWKRAGRYDPNVGSFSGYLSRYSGALVTDAVRRVKGRTSWKFGDGTVRERERRGDLGLDDYLDQDGELVGGVGAGTLDPADGRDPDLQRLLAA